MSLREVSGGLWRGELEPGVGSLRALWTQLGTQVVVGGIERMAPGAPLSPNVLER